MFGEETDILVEFCALSVKIPGISVRLKILIVGAMDLTTLPILPFDLIIAILLRVPAEFLFRLMCVCKEWRNLIRSTEFIREHFLLSAAEGNDYILCARKYTAPGNCFKLIPVERPMNTFEKDIPFAFDYAGCNLVFASKGLVCLTAVSNFNITIHLCNPFIGKGKTIRSSSIDLEKRDFTFVILGFGYHSQANDYKIVRIAYTKNNYFLGDGNAILNNVNVNEGVYIDGNGLYGGSNSNGQVKDTEVELYSLAADSWRKMEVDAFPWFLHDLHSRALLNDCLHWIGQYREGSKEKTVIVSFDIAKEIFQEIGLPNDDEYGEFHRGNNLLVYKDALSFVAFYPRMETGICSMWVMKEYGVAESWSQLFTIVDEMIHYPFTITVHGEILVDDDDSDVSLYNFFNHETRHLLSFTEPDELDFLPVRASLAFLGCEENLPLKEDFSAGSQVAPASEQNSEMQCEDLKRGFAGQSDMANVDSLAMDVPSTSTHLDVDGESVKSTDLELLLSNVILHCIEVISLYCLISIIVFMPSCHGNI